MTELVLVLTGSRTKLLLRPLSSHDPRQHQPDITLARETLGRLPAVELRERLATPIRYFQSQL